MSELPWEVQHRMGVYKRLADVPEHRRLETFAGYYDGQSPWKDYLDSYVVPPRDSDAKRNQAERSFRKWQSFMSDKDRHYALATPEDVEEWSTHLFERYSDNYAHTNWTHLERFYRWLQEHPDHPHLYNPFRMAALEYGDAADELWAIKITSARRGLNNE